MISQEDSLLLLNPDQCAWPTTAKRVGSGWPAREEDICIALRSMLCGRSIGGSLIGRKVDFHRAKTGAIDRQCKPQLFLCRNQVLFLQQLSLSGVTMFTCGLCFLNRHRTHATEWCTRCRGTKWWLNGGRDDDRIGDPLRKLHHGTWA
jgi:hypothetical protein